MNKIKYITAVLIGIAGLGLQQAKATITFPSTLNTGPGGTTGNFGTVDVSLSGQTATITFTAAANYLFIDSSVVGVQVNSTSFTEAIPTNGDPAFKNFDVSNSSTSNIDGFGRFNLVINNNDGFAQGLSTITFTVTNTDLSNLWLSASDVLKLNSNGFDAAAHVATIDSGGSLTFFVAETPGGGHVPDGGTTVMLLGVALGTLGVVRRYLTS